MDTLILKASNYEGIYVVLLSQNGLHMDPDTLTYLLCDLGLVDNLAYSQFPSKVFVGIMGAHKVCSQSNL